MVLAVLGAWLLLLLFIRQASEFQVTSRRIVIRVGRLRRRSLELPFSKMEYVSVEQSRLGRRFNYGSLTIGGPKGAAHVFRLVDRAPEFRTQLLARIDAASREERRLHKREKFVNLPAELEFRGGINPVQVLNLGIGGALLAGPTVEWPEPESPMAFTVALNRKSISLLTRLLRLEEGGNAAVSFEAMDGACESVLAKFLLSHERKRINERSNAQNEKRVSMAFPAEIQWGKRFGRATVLSMGMGGALLEGEGLDFPEDEADLTFILTLGGHRLRAGPGGPARRERGGHRVQAGGHRWRPGRDHREIPPGTGAGTPEGTSQQPGSRKAVQPGGREPSGIRAGRRGEARAGVRDRGGIGAPSGTAALPMPESDAELGRNPSPVTRPDLLNFVSRNEKAFRRALCPFLPNVDGSFCDLFYKFPTTDSPALASNRRRSRLAGGMHAR